MRCAIAPASSTLSYPQSYSDPALGWNRGKQYYYFIYSRIKRDGKYQYSRVHITSDVPTLSQEIPHLFTLG
jgi:hypothetical protein